MVNKQIIKSLIRKISAKKRTALFANVDILRNITKEEIQYYVLNFIYHHPQYSLWIMYGGSALRICHELDRMSVDLDFEIDHVVTKPFLEKLKNDLINYFAEKYGLGDAAFSIRIKGERGLLLKFSIGDDLGIDHHSKQVHISIDLNYFIMLRPGVERIPINHDQLSFVIRTYNLSTLMASKIAAIILRGTRKVGKEEYGEKGRDIYDLLWYMQKKIIPNLAYIKARINGKEIIADLHHLFERLTAQINAVNDNNLRADLTPLFLDQGQIQDWLTQWRASYDWLLKRYYIQVIADIKPKSIMVTDEFDTDNYIFTFNYEISDERIVKIIYTLTYTWFEDFEGDLSRKISNIDTGIASLVKLNPQSRFVGGKSRIIQYAQLFYGKNKTYLTKHNNIFIGNELRTKIICLSPDKLSEMERVLLDQKILLNCELEDLMQ